MLSDSCCTLCTTRSQNILRSPSHKDVTSGEGPVNARMMLGLTAFSGRFSSRFCHVHLATPDNTHHCRERRHRLSVWIVSRTSYSRLICRRWYIFLVILPMTREACVRLPFFQPIPTTLAASTLLAVFHVTAASAVLHCFRRMHLHTRCGLPVRRARINHNRQSTIDNRLLGCQHFQAMSSF